MRKTDNKKRGVDDTMWIHTRRCVIPPHRQDSHKKVSATAIVTGINKANGNLVITVETGRYRWLS